MFTCSKCQHQTQTRTGIKLHVKKKHGIKNPKNGVHYQKEEENSDRGIGLLSSEFLASYVMGDVELDSVQKSALVELLRREH